MRVDLTSLFATRWKLSYIAFSLCREVSTGEAHFVAGKHYFRDLPYSWNTLVENAVDPSHLNYSHHGVIGDRYILAFCPSFPRGL